MPAANTARDIHRKPREQDRLGLLSRPVHPRHVIAVPRQLQHRHFALLRIHDPVFRNPRLRILEPLELQVAPPVIIADDLDDQISTIPVLIVTPAAVRQSPTPVLAGRVLDVRENGRVSNSWHRDYNLFMHSRVPPRNRLAKPLPEEWRTFLVERGVPKRKYTAVLKTTLAGGRVIDFLIVEEGWIIALDKAHLAGTFEQRIDFDPRQIESIEIIQVV